MTKKYNVIVVANQKGGTGKTTTTENVGIGLAYQGNIHHEEQIDLIPSNIELADCELKLVSVMNRERVLDMCLSPLKQHYDYILIDCPPSLGMLTINALSAADNILIPVQAQYLPAKGMTKLLNTIGKVKHQINPKVIYLLLPSLC